MHYFKLSKHQKVILLNISVIQMDSLLLLLCTLYLSVTAGPLRCDLTPEGITTERDQNDVGRYRIEISGSPESYVPGEQYTGEEH